MVFMSIFNFLEPSVTIIAQAIPMFRVLVVNVKKATTAMRITSASRATGGIKSHLASQQRRWNSKVLGGDDDTRHDRDEALLHVVHVDHTVQIESTLASDHGSGASIAMEDKPYDGTLRRY